ncbi:TPR-like protein [Dacryopinax primogenitus]|uniref:TPR-like protein n=1 Tax=Dacryopinax primogenitus (strain DJM 731) TaxID=1858805 RepID=M5FUJ1_DACPD|nr:TPR-like protein [Dacryopinax primogenitus]EJT99908.1 TPR-like protein [Dacryopinax primogenitus]
MPRPPSPDESVTSHDTFTSAQEPPSPESEFTDSEARALLDEASKLKELGNEAFRSQKWEEAREKYEQALGCVPMDPLVRRSADEVEHGVPAYEVHPPEEEDEQEVPNPNSGSDNSKGKEKENGTENTSDPPAPEPELKKEARLARAVLNNNIAACLSKQNQPALAIDYCTRALNSDPGYGKALYRRALCRQEVGGWAALSGAKEDLKKLVEILPPSSPLLPSVRSSLLTLEPLLSSTAEKEKAEMFSKLKDLGNSFLGKFGLSTDNFQFSPDGKGGYAMNFQR